MSQTLCGPGRREVRKFIVTDAADLETQGRLRLTEMNVNVNAENG